MKSYKLLPIALAALMILAVLPVGVFASGSDYTYTVTNGKATITKYNGTDTEVYVPSEIDGYPVTTIGYRAFYTKMSITYVELPETVTVIERNAFQDCYALEYIYLPDSLISIGEFAFGCCFAMTVAEIPSKVEQVGRGIFDGCQSLTAIYCYMTDIPDTWHARWSEGCDATVYVIDDGLEDPVNVLTYRVKDGKAIITGIENPEGDLVIPAEIDGYPVTEIGAFALWQCKTLTSITVSEGVVSIGEGAFAECSSAQSITLPSTLQTIGSSAFSRCKTLAEIDIPDGVTSIGEWAFAYCYALKSLYIPASVTEIGGYTLFSCNLLRNVYCGAAQQPAGWHKDWSLDAYPQVHWGIGGTESDAVFGDVNGDGGIDGRDATLLLRYLANIDPATGESTAAITDGADCNADGKVNGKDITLLLRYLANFDPATGESSVVLGQH